VINIRDDTWRLFIAIELSQTVRPKIAAYIDRLRAKFPDARASWTREENLHLTLKFLGSVPIAKTESLSQALRRAASLTDAFDLDIQGSGTFPPRGNASVLWIGTSPESERSCMRLYEALEDECAKAGFARDRRKLHPHLTIARLRHPAAGRDLARFHQETEFETLTVGVSNVCLIRSELSSSGSKHTIVARHYLGVSLD
jgi:2'-5' RNA ligase